MARGFPRRGRGTPAPRRQIGNLAIAGEFDGLTTIVGNIIALGSNAIATVGDAATIVRTRGQFTVRCPAAAAGDSLIRGAFGIYVVTSAALAIGVTAMPGPLTDSGNDWYVWAPFTLAFDNTLTEFDSKYHVTVDFDSKGMRKTKAGDTSAVMLEIQSDIAGDSIDCAYVLREQVKL